MRRKLIVALMLVAACETGQPETPKPETPKHEQGEPEVREPDSKSDPNTCMPGGLEAASKVETIVLPRGCQVSSGGSLSAPTIVRNADELTNAVTCEPGSPLPAIDFAKHQLHVAEFSL